MTIQSVLITVLGLLLYSGPFVPMFSTLLFRRASPQRFQRNCWTLVILCSLQALSFIPFWLASTQVDPDDEGSALPLLILPVIVGLLLFVSTLIYAIAECAHLHDLSRSHSKA